MEEDFSNLQANDQTIEFNVIVEALLDNEKIFPPKFLYRLSNLDGSELYSLENIWEKIVPNRRLSLLEDLENLSEIDYLMSFNSIFKMAIFDPDSKVGLVAIRALWECEDPSLISIFIETIETSEIIDLQAQAAAGLGKFMYRGEVEEISEERKNQVENKLLELLTDETSPDKVRQYALEAIGYSSTPKVETLIENGYENEIQEWRRSALIAMGRSGDRRWGPFIVENLDSIDEETQLAAIKAAGEISLSGSKSFLIELLNDFNENVRFGAIWALSEIGGEGVQNLFEQMLEECEDEDEIDILENAMENLEFIDDLTDFDIFDFPGEDDEFHEESYEE